jgi:hypothetical protein
MSYRGVRNWPPEWVQTGTNGSKKLSGEIGTLVGVASDPRTGKRCYLHMKHENRIYLGTLLFEDEMFCWLTGRILINHLGRPVSEIGDLDVSFAL